MADKILHLSVTIFVLVLLIGSRSAVGDDKFAPTPEFKPNDTVQKALGEIYDAKTEQELRDKFKQLEKLSGSRAELVRQLYWYASRATDTREGMVPAVVGGALEIHHGEIVNALAPYIGTDDEKFKAIIERNLRDLEPGLQEQPRIFGSLRHTIVTSANQGQYPSQPLIQFIYRTHPGNALFNMMLEYFRDAPIEKRRPIIWAEHVVQDAIWKKEHRFEEAFAQALPAANEQLKLLADYDPWWVRLYVAEILRQHPEFGTQELLVQLKQDPHELVRMALMPVEKRPGKPLPKAPLNPAPAPPDLELTNSPELGEEVFLRSAQLAD